MPTETKDYYKTLGVKRSSSEDEIKKAYRRQARKFHPDVNPGDKTAEERFKKVQEAYDVLGDSKKKEMYDQHGFYSPQGFQGADPRAARGRPSDFGFSGFDFSDFSEAAGGADPRAGAGPAGGAGFSDLFSQFFRSADKGRNRPQPKPGEDLEYTIDISFWDAIRGTTLRLNVQRYDVCGQCGGRGGGAAGTTQCPECKGAGQVDQTVGAMRFNLTCPRCGGSGTLRNSCSGCGGSGRVSRTESVEVRIPPGAHSGSRLRVPRKGNAGAMGANPGDLYIVTRVGDHPVFKRDGDDIRITAPITPAEAILGAKIEVPTIDGRAALKIPPGSGSGKVFRLRERGVKNRRGGKRGDQYVEVRISVPAIADENTKELMREYASLNAEDPRAGLFENGG